MTFIKAYKYLFYRTYIWQLRMFGRRNNPEFLGILANSLCVFFNLLTLLAGFQIITGHTFRTEKLFAIVGMLLLLGFNYIFFLHNGKMRLILAEFAGETENQKKRGGILCWAYVIGTYLAFLVSVLILSPGVN
ncbi:MAG: hypothetical protein HOP17_16080 [Acidobacteria bacterium]|nr:hypothetical protein [Acidobacteriota bacterium]